MFEVVTYSVGGFDCYSLLYRPLSRVPFISWHNPKYCCPRCAGVQWKPASGVKVKLYDVDRTDMDDLMDEGVSDSEGRFELKGHETEFTTIDPKVNIYHDCNDENVPCLKKVAIVIPDTYVTEGEVPRKTFDAGKLNLAGTFSGESRIALIKKTDRS
uniref:Uncharacterized protein n=1 Tax=Ditylenchus dipsaci TaxID=166011 RepID=A0A915D5F2_9BILA